MVSPEEFASANKWLSWIGTAKSWAFALVAIGVVLEFLTDRLEKPYSRTVENARQEELARLNKEASDARKNAADAIERAATLEKQAQDERTAREKLQARLAWRELTEEQREHMVRRLAQYAGTQAEFITYQDDPEAVTLAQEISSALAAARWQITPSKGFIAFTLEYGIRLTWNAAFDSEAGRALAEELTRAGMHQVTTATRGVRGVEIRIGRNPQALAH